MKTYARIGEYLGELFLERKMFQINVEKIKTDFMFSNFSSHNRAVCEITWKNLVELRRKDVICMLDD